MMLRIPEPGRLRLFVPTDLRTARRWAGAVVIPVVLAGLLMWTVSGSTSERNGRVAAVVNNDQPVTVEGQLIPLGRQLAGLLVDGTDDRIRWVLTSAQDAQKGLSSGDYSAVVNVPPTFSTRATAAAASNDATKATQGMITVTTGRDISVGDSTVARQVVDAATTALNTQVVSTYLENVYLGFNVLNDGLAEAAEGADQLVGGTQQASVGARQLSNGAIQLGYGSNQLAAGAQQLADGTQQLVDGSQELAAGLAEAREQTAALPEQTAQLADGARQVADGNQQLADTVVPLANAAVAGLDALPSFVAPAVDLAQLTDECPRWLFGSFCSALDDVSATVSTRTEQLDQDRNGVRSNVIGFRDGITSLADGSKQVADGATELAEAAPELTSGLAQAAEGSQQLADGSTQVNVGAHQLVQGATQLGNGSEDLADGSDQLADGVLQVHDGMTELSTGLHQAQGDVPTFTDEERAALAAAVATPTLVTASRPATDRLQGALFLVLALWLGTFLIGLTRSRLPDALVSSTTTRVLLLDFLRPTLLLGAASGVLSSLALAVYLGTGFTRSVMLVAVGAVSGTVFALVNTALIAALKHFGRVLSILAVLMTAAVGLASTTPTTLGSLARLLPLHDAGVMVHVVTMGGSGLWWAVLGLVVWSLVAIGILVGAIERLRTVPARLLRPALQR